MSCQKLNGKKLKKQRFFFFLLFCFPLIVFSSSCVHTSEAPQKELSIVVDRESMWKTMVKVFKPYPLKNIDPKKGNIETELIKGGQVWKAPFEKARYGYSYKIQAYLTYKEPISTVSIYKTLYKQTGFISEKQIIPSDHMEESLLFYQIFRELELKKKLKL